jgi:hypothetical protein
MQCYRHPRVETGVSCGKCDRPICPKCMVAGPAGMRCPDCASLRKTALYQIPPHRLAFAVVAGLVTGIIGAVLMPYISFYVIFAGPIYGGVVAEAILRAAGRKRGRVLEVIGVGSIVVGALVACIGPILMTMLFAHGVQPPPHTAHPVNAQPTQDDPDTDADTTPSPNIGPALLFSSGLMGLPLTLLGCGLGISTCYARLKYW